MSNYRIKVITFAVAREAVPAWSSRKVINAPATVAAIARELIPDDAKEHFIVLLLDSQLRLIAAHVVSTGTLSASLVHPRDIFGPAVRLLGVASVVLIHNHPSGDATPSREDLRLTKQLVDAGKLLDISVHDHVILGSGTDAFTSLADTGRMGGV